MAKALQSIRLAHTAPLHIQPRAGAIIPVIHTRIVRQAARTIRAAQARAAQVNHTQITVHVADPRAAHPILSTLNHTPTRMTSTMITMTISGITRMLRIIGTSINKAVFSIRLENWYYLY